MRESVFLVSAGDGFVVLGVLSQQKLELLPLLVGEVAVEKPVEPLQLFDVVVRVFLEGDPHCISAYLL